MAKRRGKRTKRADARRTPWQVVHDADWRPVRKALSAVGWVLLLGGGAWAWADGVPHLRAYASTAGQAEAIDLRFLDPPAWVNGDLAAHLVLTGREAIASDPFDRGSLVAARDALLRTGWFDEVVQVRRVRADLVEVDARFVQPYAVVRDRQGDHLIDPSGRLLPKSAPVGTAARFTVIQGTRYPRPPRPGVLWEGADVTAALRLKRLITSRSWREQIMGIDVSRYHDEQTLVLLTKWGHRIRWGRPPGDETAGEVSSDRKLAYLDHLDRHFGRVDGGHDGEIDITDPRGVFGR